MTVRDVDVEYPFDDPDDGWFGRAIAVEEDPQDQTLDEPPPPMANAEPAPVEDQYYDEGPEPYDTAPVVEHAPVDADEIPADADGDVAPVEDPAPIDTDDSAATDSWYMPVADPTSSAYGDTLHEEPAVDTTDTLEPLDAETDTWYVPEADPTSTDYADAPPAEPDFAPEASANTTAEVVTAAQPKSWDSPSAGGGGWDFAPTTSPAKPSSRSGYVAAAAVAAVAVALVGAVVVIRTPGPTADDATPVAPSQTAQPAPSSAAPAPSAQAPDPLPPPAPPPPPPPPPPPVAEELNPPPVVTRQYAPSRQTADDPQKPQINVTRAPMSATPPPPPAPDRNSATPGDSPRRRGFFR